MFEIRRYWLACILAGSLLALTSCNSGSQPNQGPGSAAPSTGPGGDDDRPITMEGTSFKISWIPGNTGQDIGFEPDTGIYKHSKAAAANKIFVSMNGNIELRRKVNEPLVISLMLNSSKYDLIQAVTKRNGKHLSISASREFDDSVDDTLIHPDGNAKIETIVIENVVVASTGILPQGCEAKDGRLKCKNPDILNIKPKVVIHVCKGAGCAAPRN